MLTIRFAEPERDAAGILAVYAPYIEQTAVTFEKEVPSEAEFGRRIRGIAAQFPYLVLEEDGDIIGYAYAHRQAERAAFDWNAELSIYLRMDQTGKGLGKPLYRLLMRLLEMQGYVNFYAVITGSNMGSIAMHERMGFVRCGHHEKTGWKFGAWHDTVWLCRRVSDCTPGEILPVSALPARQVRSAWEEAMEEIGRSRK